VEKNLSEWKLTKKPTLTFFRVYIYLISMIFLLYIVCEIIQKNIVYLINKNLNTIRITFVLVINMTLISQILIPCRNMKNFTDIFIFVCSLFVSYFLSIYINNKNLENIQNSKNLVHQFAFIVNEKLEFSGNCFDESYSNEYILLYNKEYQKLKKNASLIINNHYSKCINVNCILKNTNKICPIIKFISFIKKKKKTFLDNKTLNIVDKELYKISLMALDYINPKNFNNIQSLLLLVFKYKNNNISKLGNKITIITDLLDDEIKLGINDIRSNFKQPSHQNYGLNRFLDFDLINIYANIFDDLAESNTLVRETINSTISMNYEIAFENTEKLNFVKDQIKSKYSYLNKFKNEYNDFYSFYFIKLIFKRIFNERLLIENEMQLPLELKSLIPLHFNYDNFINLIHSVNKFLIIKASRNYIDFIKTDISNIFPFCIREYERKKFKKSIQNTKNFNFEQNFIISLKNDFEKDECLYLKSCKFKIRIYPCFSLSEVILTINVLHEDEEVLIFEANVNNLKSYLKMFSQGFAKKIGLDSNLISKANGFEIVFSDILKNKLLINHQERKTVRNNLINELQTNSIIDQTENNKDFNINNFDLFYINYTEYENHFLRFIELINNKELISDEQHDKLISNFQTIKNKENNLLYLMEKLDTNLPNFTVFKLKQHHIKELSENSNIHIDANLKRNNIKKRSSILNPEINSKIVRRSIYFNQENREGEDKFSHQDQLEIYEKSVNYSINNGSSISQIYKKNQNLLKKLTFQNTIEKAGDKYTNKLINLEKSLKSLFLILFFYVVIFLIIVCKKIEDMMSIFKINVSYNTILNEYLGTLMSINMGILLYKANSLDISYYVDNIFNKGDEFDIFLYLNLEGKEKINNFKNLVNSAQSLLIQSKSIEIKDLFFNKKTKYFFLTNSNLTILNREVNFFENLDLFVSTARIIISNPERFTYIYITDDSNGDFSFKNFYFKNLSVYQLNTLNLLVNFQINLLYMEDYNDTLDGFFFDKIYDLKKIIEIGYSFMLLLNIILICLLVFNIKLFKKRLLNKILIIDSLIEENNIKYIKRRIETLNYMVLLYKKNPEDLILQLKKQKLSKIQNNLFSCGVNNIHKDFMTDKNKYCSDLANSFNNHNKSYINDKKFTKEYDDNLKEKNKVEFEMLKINRKILEKNMRKNKKIQASILLSKTSFFGNFKSFINFFIIFFLLYYICFFYNFYLLNETNILNYNLYDGFIDVFRQILSSTLLLNSMILLNQTHKNFKGLSKERDKFDFFEYINNGKYKVLNLMKNSKKNPHKDEIKLFFYDYIDCDLLYSEFYNDYLLRRVKETYIEKNITDPNYATIPLKNLCSSYYITKKKDIFLMFNYLFKENWNIYEEFLYMNKTYSKLKNLYDSNDFYDLFLVILLIFRLISSFINDSLFMNLIYKGVNSYINFIICNLIFNLMAALIFLYLVKRFIYKKNNN